MAVVYDHDDLRGHFQFRRLSTEEETMVALSVKQMMGEGDDDPSS